MTCLKDLEKILEGKKGYQELLDKVEQKDFSSIEGTDGGYMRKYVFIENNEIRDNEKLVINDEQTVWDIIEGKIDVSGIKEVKLELELHNIEGMTADKLLEIFAKLLNITSLHLGWTKLEDIEGMNAEKLLEIFAKLPNLTSLDLGLTALQEIKGITADKLLELFAKLPNLTSLNLLLTKLQDIEGMTADKIIEIFAKLPNLTSLHLGWTKLQEIKGGGKILQDLIKNFDLEYFHLGAEVDIEKLKETLPEKIRYLLKKQMKKEDLKKIRKVLQLAS